jgi:DNA repair exonuclease SbcCD ATPase subunit
VSRLALGIVWIASNDLSALLERSRKAEAIDIWQHTKMSNAAMASNVEHIPLQYYQQKNYQLCGHTTNIPGSPVHNTDEQHKAGKTPRLYIKGHCPDCNARKKLNGSSPDTHISSLRNQVNQYVGKLDDMSREAEEMQCALDEKESEIKQLRQQVRKLSSNYTEISSKYNYQSSEVGNLRKQIRELSEARTQQKTEESKRLQQVAITGYINPIASGFAALKTDLEEHRWDPYVSSLFTELQEAVRRNSYEEICDIHDHMHSFAAAFDNNLKERVEKTERGITKQCDEGVKRLLSTMF